MLGVQADRRKRRFLLELSGQKWEVFVAPTEISEVHLSFLRQVFDRRKAKSTRFIIFLAGPPGSGKSTIGCLWRLLSLEEMGRSLLVLPLDGFHFSNSYLDSRKILLGDNIVSLRSIKGAPETYDVYRFSDHLKRLAEGKGLSWPIYDRILHEPVEDAVKIRKSQRFCLIEGNYLLLDEAVWRDLAHFSSLKVFIETPEEICRRRTLARHIRGGKSPEDALQHYLRTDLRNYRRIVKNRLEADVTFRSTEERINGPFWK